MPTPLREIARNRETLEHALASLGPECEYRPARLARRLGISQRHLQRVFARALGTTPRSWLNRQRMNRAHAMLRQASCVKEVAYTLGFRHLAQFSRDFKEHFGFRPSSLLPNGKGPEAPPAPSPNRPLATAEEGRSKAVDDDGARLRALSRPPPRPPVVENVSFPRAAHSSFTTSAAPT